MINFNGRNFTEAEFAQFMEEQEALHQKEYDDFCDSVKCGYAIIKELNVVYCGLDKQHIHPNIHCKDCASYKEKVFEVIE